MKSEWEGEIEEDVRLNDGDNEKVILKRDPSTDTANLFANRVNFEYTTTSGSSTLTLQKDPSLKDMSYYYRKSYHSKSRLSFDYGFKQHRG